jgi:hypothetical protein
MEMVKYEDTEGKDMYLMTGVQSTIVNVISAHRSLYLGKIMRFVNRVFIWSSV